MLEPLPGHKHSWCLGPTLGLLSLDHHNRVSSMADGVQVCMTLHELFK